MSGWKTDKIPKEFWRYLKNVKRDMLAAQRNTPRDNPLAFPYHRVSHPSSAESGLGLESQDEMCQRWYQTIKGDFPGLVLAEPHVDKATSAFSKLFRDRDAGGKLDAALRPGDHIIFARLDRGFRNLKDMLTMLESWESRGIVVHFTDYRIDTSTPVGKLFIQFLGMVSEFRARMDSEYAKAARAAKKRRNKGRKRPYSLSGPAPWGFRHVGPRGKRISIPDDHQRQWGAYVVHLREKNKLPWGPIAHLLNDRMWQEATDEVAAGRPRTLPWRDREYGWNATLAHRMYGLEKKLREKEAREGEGYGAVDGGL